ncbi:MAG: class B sortase [Oscillospiraceae bacterium]|jgi:sortase B|nr:class B sortase [Oscillospiraceae bacterium]
MATIPPKDKNALPRKISLDDIDKISLKPANEDEPLTYRDFIPQHGDTTWELFRKFVFLISLVTIVVALIVGLTHNAEEVKTVVAVERAAMLSMQQANGDLPLVNEPALPPAMPGRQLPLIMPNMTDLFQQNKDTAGWLTIPDTYIDYPVVQTDNNIYYLHVNFDNKEEFDGTLFADSGVPLTATSRPANTIIYGHNLANGRFFTRLTNYYPKKYGSLQYYISHPTIKFDTLYEEGAYKVFAACFFNTKEEYGNVYQYFKERSFKNKAEFYSFVTNILDRSAFYTDVDLEYGDEILTLSTCYYPLGEKVDSRFAVFARRVREGENAEVDTSKAYTNTSPLYFSYYYRVNGGEWGGRNWDTTKVRGLDKFLETNEPNAVLQQEQG